MQIDRRKKDSTNAQYRIEALNEAISPGAAAKINKVR